MKLRPQPRIQVTQRLVAELQLDPRNARTHSKRQIAQLLSSIATFGFVNPVLVDANGKVIAGHGRLEAAKQLGLRSVPTIVISHLTPTQQRALALADNRIAENAGWDEALLAEALGEITVMDIDFDLSAIGFEMGEIDRLLDPPKKVDPADAVQEPDQAHLPITRTGDLWILRGHRLLCGNALELDAYARLMGSESARITVTDPPYNVLIDGHVSGLGKVQHREFAMASGEMDSGEFIRFLTEVFGHIARYSVSGAVVMSFMDWRHMGEILSAGTSAFTELLNLCVWVKTNAGMGSLYRSQHELVFIFKSGKGKHINNIELGRHGRYRTNAWSYAGANTFRQGREEDLADHPTVKPLAMIADAIKDCSRRGDIVLDPFGGSGTTLLAAERTGRRARLLEIDHVYIDVTLRRWSKLYPDAPPTLGDTGETFDEGEDWDRRMKLKILLTAESIRAERGQQPSAALLMRDPQQIIWTDADDLVMIETAELAKRIRRLGRLEPRLRDEVKALGVEQRAAATTEERDRCHREIQHRVQLVNEFLGYGIREMPDAEKIIRELAERYLIDGRDPVAALKFGD